MLAINDSLSVYLALDDSISGTGLAIDDSISVACLAKKCVKS
jgi:hypothetical protein